MKSSTVITHMKFIFARHCIPREVRSDKDAMRRLSSKTLLKHGDSKV